MPNPIQGLKQAGNLNIYTRPHIINPNGSQSTVNSISFGNDQGEVLIPGMDNTHLLQPKDAIKQYEKTGGNLGTFDTPENADRYAQQLHENYEQGRLDVPLATSRKSVNPTQLSTVLAGLLKSGPYVDPYQVK